jgi:CubicO group peptidase (beta-lactamase class C family)
MTLAVPHPSPRQVFDCGIETRTFPGAAAWLSHGDYVWAHESFGTTAYEAEYSKPVTKQTLYDIASLSKLFTATVVLIAAREAAISIDAPLARFLPPFNSSDKGLHHDSSVARSQQRHRDRGAGSDRHADSDVDFSSAQAPLHAAPGGTSTLLVHQLLSAGTPGRTLDGTSSGRIYP